MRILAGAICVLVLAVAAGSSPFDRPAVEQKPFAVPFHLTATKHIMVRCKVNGRGPYNLVMDTGAPVIVFAKKIAAEVQAKPDAGNWADISRLDVEGGPCFENVVVRFDDLYQLEGMNGLGLPGREIHGLLGYPGLARYRITYDMTQTKLTWTPVAGKPDELPRRPVGSAGPAGLNALGGLMKGLGKFLGAAQRSNPGFRGLVGLSLEQRGGTTVVSEVLVDGPAHRAGIRTGDIIVSANKSEIKDVDSFASIVNRLAAEQELAVVVRRNDVERDVVITLGAGF